MVRFARERRVFFVEEALFDADEPRLELRSDEVHVVVPHLPAGLGREAEQRATRRLLAAFFKAQAIASPLIWLYTPMMWPLVQDVPASAVVYDCMDDLSGFAGAPPELAARERDLVRRADVMFTGGHHLYESKRAVHPNVHPFPSSVDVEHFATARRRHDQPADQRAMPRPRIGFAGVIDERMNLDLVRDVAAAHPEWQFVMIGPVVKIDPATLPRAANVHYLGMKPYQQLPAYMAGWDAAMLPFAHNAATRYISPTKTPEYLAAGCPVISTSIRDVVRPYGERGLVAIADSPAEFAEAIRAALTARGRESVARAESFLAELSWDRTWAAMNDLIIDAGQPRTTTLSAPALGAVVARGAAAV
jgi:UDP-galactopyranose mutase